MTTRNPGGRTLNVQPRRLAFVAMTTGNPGGRTNVIYAAIHQLLQ